MFPARWPNSVAKRRQWCIKGHHRRRHPVLLDRNPMLNREPLVPGTWIHVLGRINYSVLNLILKLRLRHGKRKNKIDRLFLEFRLLVDLFDQLDFLFAFVKADFGLNLRRVFRR
jgi:hypothetical protein